jgi:ribosomal protein S27AE
LINYRYRRATLMGARPRARFVVAATVMLLLGSIGVAASAAADPAPTATWSLISARPVQFVGIPQDSALGRNRDGRPEYFWTREGGLDHAWQQLDGTWTDRQPLGSPTTQFTVTNEADGRLRVFAIFTDWTVHTIAQNCPNCGWGGWSANLTPGLSVPGGPILAGLDATGRLQLFVVGKDQVSVYQLSQLTPNGGFGAPVRRWSLPQRVGTDLPDNPLPAFTHNADGRPELFVPMADGRFYHAWQWLDGSWSGWADLGAAANSHVSVVNEVDGTLAAYSVGGDWNDTAVHRVAQVCPNCGWGGWTTAVPATFGDRKLVGLTVSRDTAGRVQLSVTADAPGSTGITHLRPFSLHRASEYAPGGGWNDWTTFGPLPDRLVPMPKNLFSALDPAGNMWLEVDCGTADQTQTLACIGRLTP